LNISEISKEYQEAKSKVEEFFKLKLESIKDPRHFWDDLNHSKFIYIYRQYIEKAKPRERYMERLILEFPAVSRQDLEKHDKIVESLRWNNKHRKNIRKDWENHLNALQKSAEELLEKQMDLAIDRFNKEILFVQQEKLQNRLTAEYQEKKNEFLLRLEEKEKNKAQEQEKKLAEIRKKEKERADRAKDAKNVANDYKSQKAKNTELEKNRKNQEELEKIKKNQQEIKKNKEKVEFRQTVENQKVSDRLEEQKLEDLKKAGNKARIENAVSQYQHIPKVAIDKDRVKQNTKSKDAKKNEIDLGDKAILYQQTGFTADILMKDMRYKLSFILSEAGLQNTEYGKRVIQAAPHQAPRKDTISSHFK
jgi:hypothetical protein